MTKKRTLLVILGRGGEGIRNRNATRHHSSRRLQKATTSLFQHSDAILHAKFKKLEACDLSYYCNRRKDEGQRALRLRMTHRSGYPEFGLRNVQNKG